MMIRYCKQCRKMIPAQVRDGVEYCGTKCRQRARYHENKPYVAPVSPRNCLWCELEFVPLKHDSAKYCCQAHRMNHNNQLRNEEMKRQRKADPGPRKPCKKETVAVEARQEFDLPTAPPVRMMIPSDIDAPVRIEPREEWSLEKCRRYYNLDGRDPARYVSKSLAECEAMNRRGNANGNR